MSDMRVQQYLQELERTTPFGNECLTGSVRYYIAWYGKRYPKWQRWTRTIGIAMLVVSIATPFATTLLPKICACLDKETIVTGLGFALALLGGLGSFLQIQRTWQGYIDAHLKLLSAWCDWEVARVQAVTEPDATKGFTLAVAAADTLLKKAADIVGSETGQFFRDMRMPEAKTSKAGS